MANPTFYTNVVSLHRWKYCEAEIFFLLKSINQIKPLGPVNWVQEMLFNYVSNRAFSRNSCLKLLITKGVSDVVDHCTVLATQTLSSYLIWPQQNINIQPQHNSNKIFKSQTLTLLKSLCLEQAAVVVTPSTSHYNMNWPVLYWNAGNWEELLCMLWVVI